MTAQHPTVEAVNSSPREVPCDLLTKLYTVQVMYSFSSCLDTLSTVKQKKEYLSICMVGQGDQLPSET